MRDWFPCSIVSTIHTEVYLPTTKYTVGWHYSQVPLFMMLNLKAPTKMFLFVDGCSIICGKEGGKKNILPCLACLYVCLESFHFNWKKTHSHFFPMADRSSGNKFFQPLFTWDVLISSLFLKGIFARCRILSWFFKFTLNILFYSLLSCKISPGISAGNFIECCLHVISHFSFLLFFQHSLSLALYSSIIIFTRLGFFWFILTWFIKFILFVDIRHSLD